MPCRKPQSVALKTSPVPAPVAPCEEPKQQHLNVLPNARLAKWKSMNKHSCSHHHDLTLEPSMADACAKANTWAFAFLCGYPHDQYINVYSYLHTKYGVSWNRFRCGSCQVPHWHGIRGSLAWIMWPRKQWHRCSGARVASFNTTAFIV